MKFLDQSTYASERVSFVSKQQIVHFISETFIITKRYYNGCCSGKSYSSCPF